MPISAVIFDMDGLLVNSEPLWRKAEIEVFERVGLSLSEDDCRLTMGMRMDEVARYWFRRQPWEGMSTADLSEAVIDRVIELIVEEGEAMPGVMHALELCQLLNLRCAVASSSPLRLLRAVLEKWNWTSYFTAVESAQTLEHGKPHPAIFLNTAEELGELPEDCVVLEDSFNGVIAALAASMRVIAIPDKTSIAQPRFQCAHAVISSLSELNSTLLLG